MKPLFVIACLVVLIMTPLLEAQTTTNSAQSTSLADNKPIENASGSAVRQRAPGLTITAARARHLALREARLTAQRSGDNSNLLPEESSSSSSGGTSGFLSNLLNSVSPSLSSLLGISTSTGSSTTGTSTNNFSNLPPEVLQMLTSFGISLSDLQNAKQTNTAASTKQTSQTAQTATTTTTTQQSDFVVRWANAMLSTMFTTLTVAVQTTDFINLLKDIFRPLFGIEKETSFRQTPGQFQPHDQAELKRFFARAGGGSHRLISV